jgi:hypothetical protein
MQRLNSRPHNLLVFLQTTATANPSGCSIAAGFYFPVTQDYQKRMFAILIAATMAGKRVQLYVNGTCHAWGYAEVLGVSVE